MTSLRQKMTNDMKLRGLSPRTQQSCLKAVTGLAKFFNQSPDRLSKEHVQEYLLYLMEERRLSWSSCNIAVSAFRFLYGKTLESESMRFAIPPRKKITKLPEILSAEEIERLFASTDNPKHRMILMTAYGGGLRVSEVVKLKVNDIHKDRMTVRVDQGKGNKDMLEAGHDVRTIQMLMGHSSIMTTIVYLQVTQKKMDATKSPLDLLEIPTARDCDRR